MAAPVDASFRQEIRKLRKKLRQIEKLEDLERDITDEEYLKIEKKDQIRAKLLELLTQVSEQSELSSSSVCTESSLSAQSYPQYAPTTESIEEEPERVDLTTEDDSAATDLPDEPPAEPTPELVPIKSSPVTCEDDVAKGDSATPESVPDVPQPSKKARKEEKKKSKKVEVPQRPVHHPWRGVPYSVRPLEGHNNIIQSTDLDQNLLVTGSRDTMVKVWDVEKGDELRSFGGHSDTVTCVCLLDKEQSKSYGQELDIADDDQLVFSCSLDSCIKIWAIKTGKLVKSIYTYNPVTALAYMSRSRLLVSTSDGGKLELWEPATGTNEHSLMAHDDSITALTVHDECYICIGTIDGLIKLYQYRNETLNRLYVSERVTCAQGLTLFSWEIRCLRVLDDSTILFGDEGVNIKVLEWKKGVVRKVRNHGSEFGVTDSIMLGHDTVIASGYDLDNGRGYLNVFSKPDLRYLCTLSDDDTGRILSTSQCSGRWVTSGTELKIWDPTSSSGDCRTVYAPSMSDPAVDTDVDEDDDVTGSDDDFFQPNRDFSPDQPSGWSDWCSIL